MYQIMYVCGKHLIFLNFHCPTHDKFQIYQPNIIKDELWKLIC